MFGCDILGQDSSSSVWTWCSLIFNGLPPNRPRRTSCSWSKTTLVALLESLVLWARAWWCPRWWNDGPSAEGSILLRGQCFSAARVNSPAWAGVISRRLVSRLISLDDRKSAARWEPTFFVDYGRKSTKGREATEKSQKMELFPLTNEVILCETA